MSRAIESEALRTFLYGILSCKCPVTPETEQRLFDAFRASENQSHADYDAVVSIADTNPERTPIHNLFDFCAWARDDPSSFTITANDVLRYLASSFHYRMVTAGSPGVETENPGLLLSHILIPVSVRTAPAGFSAVYETGDTEVRFSPVVVPEPLEMTYEHYALHMGVVLCGLSEEQTRMITAHQALITDFQAVAGRVETVDFTGFPPFGDHSAQVLARFRRNGVGTR